MEHNTPPVWPPALNDPTGRRSIKPRKKGITMLIDKGLGLRQLEDLIETAAPYIDILKLGFGTSALYPPELLTQKIKLLRDAGISVMPGGTFFEVAVVQGHPLHYFKTVKKLGFDAVEVSDGTMDLSLKDRGEYIQRALEQGLSVMTEYGKKAIGSRLDIQPLMETIHQDLIHGATLVTVEGRESGKGVGIYDEAGESDGELIGEVVRHLSQPHVLLWEAPHKDQQVGLMRQLGAEVNLGNISPTDVLALEALRRGLRSDTFDLGLEAKSPKASSAKPSS